MCAAAQAVGDLDGIECTAGSVRAVVERIAKEQEMKAKKAETDARLRELLSLTRTPGAPRRRRGAGARAARGGRVSWKKAAADLSNKSAAIKKALEAQAREIKVKLPAAQAQAQALAPRPPAPLPPGPSLRRPTPCNNALCPLV